MLLLVYILCFRQDLILQIRLARSTLRSLGQHGSHGNPPIQPSSAGTTGVNHHCGQKQNSLEPWPQCPFSLRLFFLQNLFSYLVHSSATLKMGRTVTAETIAIITGWWSLCCHCHIERSPDIREDAGSLKPAVTSHQGILLLVNAVTTCFGCHFFFFY